MADIDWTQVIVAFIGGGGTLTALVGVAIHLRKPKTNHDAEERAATTMPTPASPGPAHDVEAIRLAQQAMSQVTSLSEKLDSTTVRLGEVERELSLFRRSYLVAYRWMQWVRGPDWDTIRDSPNPPELPPDIHHPD